MVAVSASLRSVLGQHRTTPAAPTAPSALLRRLARPGPRPYRQTLRRCSPVCMAPSPELVFGAATVAVLPFYLAMAAAPRLAATASLLSSELFYLLSAALYAALLLLWAPLPQFWHAAVAATAAGGPLNVAPFAALFAVPGITALTWIHLLVLDLFQARLVYLDGLQHRVPTVHSAVLCFMVGPLGLLSHLATKSVLQWWRARHAARVTSVLA